MAFSQERPHSFAEALRLAERLLSADHDLVRKGLVRPEAEQIVTGAYRKATGKLLRRAELYSRVKDRFPEDAGQEVIIMARARAEGRPLQHLIGHQVFLGHEYDVGPDVLVPRPETEGLVSYAIGKLRRELGAGPAMGLEIGIGSGAISIELLSAFPLLRMVASELSERACSRAAQNASRILGEGPAGSGRLTIVRSADPAMVWEPFGPVAEGRGARFLISNPPYLSRSEPIDRDVLAYEPHEALFAPGEDPFHFYRRIAARADEFLSPGGSLFLEIPSDKGIRSIFDIHCVNVKIMNDLNGRERILHAKLAS